MNSTELVSKYPKEEYFRGASAPCPGCGITMALRYFLIGMGGKVIFVSVAGCSMTVFLSGRYPCIHQGKPIPSLWAPFGSSAIFAGGLKSARVARGDTETEVVVWVGDGATFDIGMGGLSAAAERNENIIYVCCDNEAYQNTGNQRGSSTPKEAKTSTTPPPKPKVEQKKDIMAIMLGHGIPYASTLTVAYPDDFIRKVQKAKCIKGFRFLHALTPCPTGWQFLSEWTVKVSRLAVETKIFPLYEVENGSIYTINREPQGIPVEEYTKIQGRYGYLTPEQTDGLQTYADEKWNRLKWVANYGRANSPIY
jgi:pyruvate/2-oxoacid:ferredoxin oxidoreductase beta subunit